MLCGWGLVIGWQDEVARIAQGDQQEAGLAQLALMLRGYYQNLLDAGFSKVEALHLATNYQNTLAVGALAQAAERKKRGS